MNSLLSVIIPKRVDQLQRVMPAQQANAAIRLSIMIGKIAQDALQAYLNNQLHLLNPLVGENACQMRAIQLQTIFNEGSKDEQALIDKINRIEKELGLLQKALEEKLDKPQSISKLVKTLLGEEAKPLNQTDKYIILCRLLTLTRDEKNSLETNELQLLKLIAPAKKEDDLEYPVKEMVFHCKSELANISLEELKKSAKKITNVYDKLLGKNNLYDANGQHLLTSPCFYNLSAVLDILEYEQRLTYLKIVSKKSNEELCIQVERKECQPINPEAAVIMKCTTLLSLDEVRAHLNTSDKKTISMEDFKSLVLINAALHPSYSGKARKKDIPLFLHKDLQELLESLPRGLKTKEEVTAYLTKYLTTAERNAAKTICNPISVEEICLRYLQLQSFKQEKEPPIQILHIYADYINTEILDSSHGKEEQQ